MLLEREGELGGLEEHWSAVSSDRSGTAVFVGGEAGVGKTALLRELASRCDSRVPASFGWGGTTARAPSAWPVLGSR